MSKKECIPKKIFQTWKTKTFSKDFQKIVDSWKIHNPEYEYYLYDDIECEQFLKDNFDEKIYNTYCKIIPGAYKSDLWRYCILYKYGGIYADIDTLCLGNIDSFLNDNIEFMVPIDLNQHPNEGKHNLFNTFIATVPKSPILLHCIKRIVNYVENSIRPSSLLDFSGPGVLGRSTNIYLNLPETNSFVGNEGIHGNIHFLKFESRIEYVKDTHGNILFQNKNGNSTIINLYNDECKKTNNISWLSSKPF